MNGISNGETIPDDVTVDLTFTKDGYLLRCDAPVGDWPDNLKGKILTALTELNYQSEVCVARGSTDVQAVNTLITSPPELTFMDVGRWGDGPNPQRSFGLVYGKWAALCEFSKDEVETPPIVDAKALPMNNVIAALCGPDSSVRLVKCVTSTSTIPVSEEKVHVILGDLHLPIINRRPATQEHWGEQGGQFVAWQELVEPQERMGRYKFDPSRISSVMTWYDRYLAGDIFGGAGADLVRFAELLGASRVVDRIHFVQAGDMYDLWIGLERFFDECEAHEVRLHDREYGKGVLKATEFVDYWMGRTAEVNPGVIKSLHGLKVCQTWLWGNHDCYLAACDLSGVPKRQREYRENGVYIEHGHRCDNCNRDGSVSGHFFTNLVFTTPSLREGDPNRRDYYLTYAALAYVAKPDFAVYVMGHTHSPFLTRLTIQASIAPPEYPTIRSLR